MKGANFLLRRREPVNKRKRRNITVAVSPELYHQTRLLAVEFDTTVTSLVAYLLERMPTALRQARYPKGGPKPASPAPVSSANPSNPGPAREKNEIPACTPVNATQAPSLSETCEPKAPPCTGPVPQYKQAQNDMIQALIDRIRKHIKRQ